MTKVKAKIGTKAWVRAEVEELRAALEAVATPERAEQERAYLKSELEHLGAKVPDIRKIARDYHARSRELDDAAIRALVAGLWAPEVHELRSLAVALLERWRKRLRGDDLPLLEGWLRAAKTWALVDWIAVKLVGVIMVAEPEVCGPVLDRWASDDDFWLRRSAMLALLDPLRAAGSGDPLEYERFERYATAMLGETEFFIRKAIGWILRDLGRKRPHLTRRFVKAQLANMSGLTLREAIKALPETEAAQFRRRHTELRTSNKRARKRS